jgi:Fic family protein
MTENRFLRQIKINKEILSKIAKIDEFKGLWHGGLRLNPQILGKLKASVIITSTGASTRIEGAKMNDDEVARLLRGLKSNPPKGRDQEEVAGYADLLGRIFDNFKTLKLTEGQILQFHKILLNFSKKDENHKGKYKSKDNVVVAKNEKGEDVVLFRPTPPYLVKKEMDDILFWTNQELEKKEIHPLLVIANFIFEFLAIHPFEDGNGRLSRALTNLLLLKSGYSYIPYVSLEEIIEEQRTEYYLALRATQKNHKTGQEDISPWLNFLLDALIKQTQKAKKIMESEQPEKLLSEKQLQVYNLFGKDKTLGVAEIDKKVKGKIPKVTIKQALSRLVNLKLLDRIGQGRATRYKKL